MLPTPKVTIVKARRDTTDTMYQPLVIDDDERICKILHLYLARFGFEVKAACDGERGIDLFDPIHL